MITDVTCNFNLKSEEEQEHTIEDEGENDSSDDSKEEDQSKVEKMDSQTHDQEKSSADSEEPPVEVAPEGEVNS